MEDLGIGRLRTFVAVADKGSVSLAAQQVGRTQSAVSLQMRILEELAGVRLLRRLRHGVQLTSKGEELLSHARTILRAHDRALLDISGQPVVGEISLGCPDDYAGMLPSVLTNFAAEYPRMQIQLTCAPTPDLRRMLGTGELDLTVVTQKRAKKEQLLRREQLVWVGRADMEKIDHPVVPLAVSHAESIDRLAALEALARSGRQFKIVCSSGSLSGIEAALDAGIAVAVLAGSIVPERLKVLRHGWPRLPLVDVAVLHASPRPSPVAKQLELRLRAAA